MMANSWFEFKQFTIRQDRCSMKVGTDGVILGAWTHVNERFNCLDIGTGTGLIALMLAQRNTNLNVDAIEVNAAAARQAEENVRDSPFSNRIQVLHVDFRQYSSQCSERYDLIVSNPPYFSTSVKPGNLDRSIARHSDQLMPGDLIQGAERLLTANGILSLIYPYSSIDNITQLAEEAGLFPFKRLCIRPNPGKSPVRVCVLFSRKNGNEEEEHIVIENHSRHDYSREYVALTKAFYLKF